MKLFATLYCVDVFLYYERSLKHNNNSNDNNSSNEYDMNSCVIKKKMKTKKKNV